MFTYIVDYKEFGKILLFLTIKGNKFLVNMACGLLLKNKEKLKRMNLE